MKGLNLAHVAADILLAPLGMSHADLPARTVKSVYDNDPDWLTIREEQSRAACACCKRPIFTDKDGYTHKGTARLQRGSFAIPDRSGEWSTNPHDNENIKCELYICEECWLTNSDLCAFFNRIGFRVR